ncbi:MAG: UDP-N-acetylmuramoyl-tripeptide--D-alanyl-D-alanine ligase [Paenibacillaceae bacterium]
MIQRTLHQMCNMMIGAELRADVKPITITGVSTDTRTIQDGNLFVPLVGDHYDGHEYVQTAHQHGAVAVLWQRDHTIPTVLDEIEIPVILVDNTLIALQQLAASYRQQLVVRVIGITGSNGKTSTKDMVASVMNSQFKVHKTKGNLNNQIGLPLTLLQMDETTEIAVVEMGMSGQGEIELLSKIACPDAAIITNVGEAHMLQLGSREGIARAKFEIMAGMQDGGVLIYHGDESLLRQLVEQSDYNPALVITFGSGIKDNDYSPSDIRIQADQSYFAVNVRGNAEWISDLAIPLLGRHNVINALAAIAVAQLFGLDDSSIRSGLHKTIPTGMRIELLHAKSGLTILNDAYNASPASMKAAIQLLDELEGFQQKIVVLGDMLELGPQSESFHRDIGKLLNTMNFDYVFTFGEMAAFIAEECRIKYSSDCVQATTDKAELAKRIAAVAKPQDIVLVKASRGKRLEELVEVLSQI